MPLEAKCPDCGARAEVDDNMSHIRCKSCGFIVSYDEYIEIMKTRAVQMADDLQIGWDKT